MHDFTGFGTLNFPLTLKHNLETHLSLRRHSRKCAAAFTLVLIATLILFAAKPVQAERSQKLQGVISDSAHSPISTATLTFENVATHTRRTIRASENGAFSIPSLASGHYHATVSAPGYLTVERDFVLQAGFVAGATLSVHMTRDSGRQSHAALHAQDEFQLHAANPIELVTSGSTRTAKLNSNRMLAANSVPRAQGAAVNPAADFSIYSPVIAANPQRFGFNTALAVGPTNNAWILTDGTNATDTRLALTATDDGSDTTFIATNANGNPGTDFYQSIITGYFVGATAHVYRFSNNAWSLVRTSLVTGYTAVVGSNAIADHTITFDASGPATKAGDVVWLTHDNVPALPNADLLYYRSADYSTYYPDWQTETSKGWPIGGPAPYTLDTDVPPSDPTGLSAKVTDANTELQGFTQYTGFFQCPTSEVFELGHTYRLGVWLKQQGIADSNVTVSISQFNISHTFQVTGNWAYYTFDFQAPNCLPANSVIVGHRLDYNAPGTLWENGLKLYNIDSAPFSLDSRILQAWTDYKPSTMRIWSNFGDSSGGYGFWSLDSWLLPEDQGRSNPGIGNYYENRMSQGHLPEALAEAKQIGANPWLIISMSLSAEEWSNLIDYLAAPAGVGYAARRPANHPGPYTDDFQKIYFEVGNEEWGTQQVPVNFAYGQWAHYVADAAIHGKSYADPNQLKFVLNSFFLQPSFGSAAAAQAPEATVVDYALYNSGDQTLTGDAYYQSDLIQLPATNKALIDEMQSQQKIDAANGHPYSLAAYEAGPGEDTPVHQGDTSLAAAVANLDVDLYASLRGFDLINYFLFNLGSGPYSSHSRLTDGLRPHPAWQAMQMRNTYLNGDMVWVVGNNVPTTTDGNNYPLIGVYAFHDTSNGGNVADVAVISRDLNNATPVTLHFPGTPTGEANLYTLTGDPRANNDTTLEIPIGTQSLTGVTKDYTFSMPPGSVYMFQVPIGTTWDTSIPAPAAPVNLQAVADNQNVQLSWAAVDGATTYNVKRGTAAGGPYTIIASIAGSGYTDHAVVNGTTYYYVVTALNTGGESANSNQVAATPNVVIAALLSSAPPLDGSDTGAWTTAPSIPLTHDFNTYTPDTASYKTLWDANNLYVLATVQDATPTFSPGQYGAFNGDSVEVYFSGTDSKGSSYGPTDFQYAFPFNGTTVSETKHNALSGVTFSQQTLAGGYRLAIAIPWTTLGTTPVAGKQYGFEVMVNDATSPNNRIGKLAWWATFDFTYANPSLMGPLVLSPNGNLPSTATALNVSAPNGLVSRQPATLTASVTPTTGSLLPTGTVTFSLVGKTTYKSTIKLNSAGNAVWNLLLPTYGNYSFTATYNGSAQFSGSVSAATPETISGVVTNTSIQVAPGTSVSYRQPWTIAATVTQQDNSPTPQGTITFSAGKYRKSVAVDAAGNAVWSVPALAVGVYPVTAVYSGTSVFAPSTSATASVTIAPSTTTTVLAISPASSIATGQPYTLTAKVAATSGLGTPTGSVTFTTTGSVSKTARVALDSTGTAILQQVGPQNGSYTVTATFSGSDSYAGSTSAPVAFSTNGNVPATRVALTQTPSSNLIVGQPWTLKARVTPVTGTAQPDGTVTFFWKQGKATVTVDAGGNAQYDGVVPPIGANSVAAHYNGSTGFSPSTSPAIAFTVQGPPTTTTLAANPSGTVVTGQSLTLTAVVAPVTGTTVPTGTVKFTIGSTVATIALDGSGTATYTAPAPAPGTYALTAAYSGSGVLAASTSTTLSQVVTAISTLTALNVAPSFGLVSGQSWTLAALVTAQTGTAIPTGSVTFNIGSTTAQAVLDSTGKATFVGTAPPPGTYSITAAYAGTSTFAPSTSSAVNETIVGAPTATSLVVAPSLTLAAGQPFTLTSQVTSTGSSATPTGSVTFNIGSATQVAPLNGSGVATYSAIAPAAGTYTLTAVYSGSATFATSSSPAQNLTVAASGTPLPVSIVNPSFEVNPQRYSAPDGWVFTNPGGTSTNYAISDIVNYPYNGVDGSYFWAPGDFNPSTPPVGSSTAVITTATPVGSFVANTQYHLTVSLADPADGRDPSEKTVGFQLIANGVVVGQFASTSLPYGGDFADYSLDFYTSTHPEVVGQDIKIALVYTYRGQYNRGAYFDNVRLSQTYGVVDPGVATTTTLAVSPATTVTTGNPFTVTATVTPATGSLVPSGSVLFTIGSASQTVSLDGTGTAVYSGTAPAVGTYNVTAAYSGLSGTPAFASSTSATTVLTVVAPTGVGPVTGLSATGGDGFANLAWTAASNAVSYNVYQGSTTGGESSTPVLTGITGTTVSITGLTDGTAYFFTVRGVNGATLGDPSNEISVTPVAPPPANPPLAYEPFNAATGALNGLGDGSGWSDNWAEQSSSTAIPGYDVANASPLTYTGLATTGNYAVGGYRYEASGRGLDISASGPFASYLNSGLIGAPGTVLYASFLIRKDSNDTQPSWLSLHSSNITEIPGSAQVAAGYFGDGATAYWSLNVNGTVTNSTKTVSVGATTLLVVKIAFGATNAVSLYVNPTPGSEPAVADASASTASSISFRSLAWLAGYGTNSGSLDEVRIGAAFADVTPSH